MGDTGSVELGDFSSCDSHDPKADSPKVFVDWKTLNLPDARYDG
jgi:hypothetical protein